MKGFGDLVKQAQKMQKDMAAMREKLAAERFSASVGGAAVTAVVDGQQRLISIQIRPEALADRDAGMLEDLILAAVSEAQRASEARMNEMLSQMTGGIKLPF
jgi:DNA-binding YbaB/EbfC family protein